MKKNRFIIGFLLLSFVFAGTAFAFDRNVTGSPISKDAPQAAIEGTWDASGKWFGGVSWDATWTITQRGPFFNLSSSSGASASGITLGPVVIFKYSMGCEPIYIGFASSDSMNGLMRCTSGDGTGMWQATKTSSSAQAEPQEDDLNYDVTTDAGPAVE